MKSRKLGIALLVMLALVVTSGTFAYWASSVATPTDSAQTGTVTVGTGGEVATKYTIGTNASDNSGTGTLVPAAYADAANSKFGSRTIAWDVQWANDEAAQAVQDASVGGATVTGDISATVTWVVKDSLGTIIANSAGTVTTYTGTITVTPDAGNVTSITLDATASTFAFVLTMGEPSSQAQYDLIAGGSIEVTVTYSVSNPAIS